MINTLLALTLTPYLYIGTGYKFNEPSSFTLNGVEVKMDFGSKISAIFELGFETESGWRLGYAHHSQWSTGKPFNSKDEYYKDEIFIGKKWTF